MDEDTGASGYTAHLLWPGMELQKFSPEALESAVKRMRDHIVQMKRRQSS